MITVLSSLSRRLRLPLWVLCLSLSIFSARGQGDAMFTQYWALPTYYNPATSGNIDFIRIRGGAKLQWLGIDNAPKDFLATADMPIKLNKKSRLGVGALFSQESIGLYRNLEVGVQVSYKFKALKGVWSVGLQPAFYNSKFKGEDIYIPEGDDFHQSDDPNLPNTDVSGNVFDLSAGVHYQHKWFSVGISVLHIMQPTVSMSDEGGSDSETVEFQATLPRRAYFIADSNIPIKNSLFSLQPSLNLNTDFSQFSGEVTMRATYNKFISFGVGYRYKEAISAMIAAEFKNFFIGYAYDYPLSRITKGSSGSHEVVIGYNVKLNLGDKNKNKQRSIRIM
ncbi:MAG: PorP/SprF family type IX secretion system membrane protein [Muribaculaceae bacterium]|nr:PorP/SprF family type IX secretion system membrane protein [Muribaculaceae bacterium]